MHHNLIVARLNVDPAELLILPRDAYAELAAICEVLEGLMRAKSLLAACRALAGREGLPKTKVLYRRVGDYMRRRDWRVLVDRRMVPGLWQTGVVIGLPAEFKQFVLSLDEKHARTFAGAYEELMLIWKTHHDNGLPPARYDKIPGYDKWPKAAPGLEHPAGWSERQLRRVVEQLRDPYEQAAAKEGLFAASEFRPPVRTTRVGLKLGERYEFDDHEFDVKVHFAGQKIVTRPICFGGVDGLSAFFDMAVRPILWDADAEKKRKLTEQQFRFFLLHWLCAHGYRGDEAGTILFLENGTATVRRGNELERKLYCETGGKVRLSRGSMFARAAHPGQFAPRGKGNFKFKPLIEGAWRIIEDRLQRLPGRTGSNARLNGPAELHGREQYALRVLKQAEQLPAEYAAELLLPVATFGQFSRYAFDAIHTLMTQTDHDLEGWDALGFERVQWRPDPDAANWYEAEDLARLPESEQLVLRAKLGDPALPLTRAVKRSRAEVWALHREELTRLTPNQYCRLLELEDAVEVTVPKNRVIEFEDKVRFGPGRFRFLADSRGRTYLPGEKYLLFFNPLDPRVAQLCNAHGAHVGLVEAWEMPSDNDLEGIKRQMGRQAAWEAPKRGHVAARQFDEAAARAHMLDHNRGVVAAARAAESGHTPEHARELRRYKGGAEELLEPAPIADGAAETISEAEQPASNAEGAEAFSAEGLL
jgi:hypothetical protein